VYAITGNGTFDASTPGGRDYGDSIIQLTLGTSGFVVSDFFTPFEQNKLDELDGDPGSSHKTIGGDASRSTCVGPRSPYSWASTECAGLRAAGGMHCLDEMERLARA
jgi:hypothetical protein